MMRSINCTEQDMGVSQRIERVSGSIKLLDAKQPEDSGAGWGGHIGVGLNQFQYLFQIPHKSHILIRWLSLR